MAILGVNIDHVATLRQARRGVYPDPVEAAAICLKAGAQSIVAHLREDRRHIQDRDVVALRRFIKKERFNLEMSLNSEIVAIALKVKPDQVTLVPERRQELTTEGGLDVIKYRRTISRAVDQLKDKGIMVSLFIDPDQGQVEQARGLGVEAIEIHTGTYAQANTAAKRKRELNRIAVMTDLAYDLGLIVNAGHGLDYQNTSAIAQIPHMHELNIGYSIICQSIFTGLDTAVREMNQLVRNGHK